MNATQPGSGPTAPDLRTVLGAVEVPRDVVRVRGPEAVGYLHGQLSQDVEDVDVGVTTWSFVLQPTGKVDAWVRVTRTAGDELLLDVDRGWGEALVARLRRFLLRTKADIDPLDWACVALRGPGATEAATRAAEALADPAEPGADGGAPERVLALPAGWPRVDGGDLLGPAMPSSADIAPVANAPVVDLVAYESLRIRSGVPAMGTELTERTIPAEVGQWIIDASVSFTKGCFTGQELVARIDSRGGNVPRRLRGLVVVGDRPVPSDAPVVVDGTEVGRVTSAAPAPDGEWVALAYLGRAVTPPATAEIHAGDQVLAASVHELPLE